jgi:hypothetical protein
MRSWVLTGWTSPGPWTRGNLVCLLPWESSAHVVDTADSVAIGSQLQVAVVACQVLLLIIHTAE